MPLSAAERARRYREKKKADPISREEYLLKERQRQRDIYVPVKDQAKRAKREIRRRWKENKRASRKKQIEILVLQNQLATPPVSPLEEQQRANEERASSRQRGRKKVRRDRAKAYREIGSLKLKLAYQERATQKYKKRYYRTVAKLNKNGPTATPRSRAKWLLGSQHRHIPKEVRRTLIFHNALTDELKEKYKQNGELRMKQLIRKIATGRIIKKYRMLDRARQVLACHIGCGTDHGNLTYTRKARSDALTAEQRHTITAFFERDDNSRMSPGKKDTITKNKVKKQKRLLSDTMKILHEKFLFEHPLIKVCYSTFCTLRPFWVIKPKLTDRNTCLCKRHCNVELMAEKLHREGIISSNNPVEQFAHLVCSRENKSCMYGDCSLCDGKRLPKLTNGFNNKELTYYFSYCCLN